MAILITPTGLRANGYDVQIYDSATGQLEIFHNNVAVLQTVSGGVQSSTFTGSLNGNANTASQLQSARTITLTGDVTGSVSFNGSTNVSISTTSASSTIATGQVGANEIANGSITSTEFNGTVTLNIINSAGTTVKTLRGPGS